MSLDSSVGIATAYGLDGPGWIPGSARLFSTESWETLRPTQPPTQWTQEALSPGRETDHSPPSSIEVIKSSYCLFYDSVSISDCIVSNKQIIGKQWIGKDLEEINSVLLMILCRFLPKETVTPSKSSLMIADVPANIETDNLSSINVKNSPYNSLLGKMLMNKK
jgi:hypothetical protein